jgi:hypothetical protein
MSLHVVATSPSPQHRKLLEALARAGGGVYVWETNYARLRERFREAVLRAAGRFVRSGPLPLVPAPDAQQFLGALRDVPAVGAINRTALRPEGRAVLSASSGEPVLAIRHIGLGRSCSFATRFDGGWGGELARWPSRLALLSRMLREIAPPPSDPSVEIRVNQTGAVPRCEVFFDENASAAVVRELTLELWPGASSEAFAERPVPIGLERVGLRRYQAELDPVHVRENSTFVARLVEGGRGRELWRGPLVLPPMKETRLTGALAGSLDGLARAAGGRLLPHLQDAVALAARRRSRSRTEATAPLAALALVLALVELALRFRGVRRSDGRAA